MKDVAVLNMIILHLFIIALTRGTSIRKCNWPIHIDLIAIINNFEHRRVKINWLKRHVSLGLEFWKATSLNNCSYYRIDISDLNSKTLEWFSLEHYVIKHLSTDTHHSPSKVTINFVSLHYALIDVLFGLILRLMMSGRKLFSLPDVRKSFSTILGLGHPDDQQWIRRRKLHFNENKKRLLKILSILSSIVHNFASSLNVYFRKEMLKYVS